MKRSRTKFHHDVCSQAGAIELEKHIREFWQQRGYIIETVVAPIPGRSKSPVHMLRSNLVNGLPPRRSKIAA
jgi:hypothetical protein